MQIVTIPVISHKSIYVLDECVCPCTDTLLLAKMHNRTGSDIEIKAGDQIARLEILTPKELLDVNPQHSLKGVLRRTPHLNETERSTKVVMPVINCTNFDRLDRI